MSAEGPELKQQSKQWLESRRNAAKYSRGSALPLAAAGPKTTPLDPDFALSEEYPKPEDKLRNSGQEPPKLRDSSCWASKEVGNFRGLGAWVQGLGFRV